MMNKLKYLFLFVLCAALIGGAALNITAQTDGERVLVAGKKPLLQSDVDGLLEFHEWIFDTAFTRAERRTFQSFVEREYRGNPAATRRNADEVIETMRQIRALDAGKQKRVREMTISDYLADLRKTGGDEDSQFLLGIYERTQNGGGQTTATESDDESGEDSYSSYEKVKKVVVGNFSAIVGKWVSGNTGSMTTTTSGVYLGGNASRHTYQFSANGAVEYTGIMNMMTGGCRMQIFKTAKGKATLDGSTLTINWSPASFSRDDSCSPSKNYKKTLPAETETFQIDFQTYFNDKQLCLTTSDKICFSRD